VKKFFTFRLNNDDLELRPVGWKALAWTFVGALIFGLAWTHNLLGAVLVAAVAVAAAYGLGRWLAKLDLKRREQEKTKNHAEFEALADQVRAIQRQDVTTAFLRVFKRTQIELDAVKNVPALLTKTTLLGRERELFDEASLAEQIGELKDRSVRLLSPGDFSNVFERHIRWVGTSREELFFNPMRLVTLFLAEKQMVVCDVQIDSIDGDLSEEIQRVAFPKIVNIRFTAERTRMPMTLNDLVRFAEDFGYTKAQIEEMRKEFGRTDDGVRPWVREKMLSSLGVTRTDGTALTMPISPRIFFGRHQSALDQGQELTDEESAIDKIVNELNRRVESPDGHDAPKAKAAGSY